MRTPVSPSLAVNRNSIVESLVNQLYSHPVHLSRMVITSFPDRSVTLFSLLSKLRDRPISCASWVFPFSVVQHGLLKAPEVIFLNEFKYEPILDMSGANH
jgi:hypothetical protein